MRALILIAGLLAVAPAPALAGEPPAASAAAKKGKRQRKGYFTGWVGRAARKEPPKNPTGALEIEALGSGETIATHIYNPDGTFNTQALAELDRVFRCHRTEHEATIDPAVYEILSHVYDKFGRRILLISGHRTNTQGFHFRGAAADIRVDGVPLGRLRMFVESLDAGGMGVGLYPRGNFIHLDVRPPPSYRWIDRSPPGGRRRPAKKRPVS